MVVNEGSAHGFDRRDRQSNAKRFCIERRHVCLLTNLTETRPPASLVVRNPVLSTLVFELRVPRDEPGRIGKRVRFPRGPATVMLSKPLAIGPLIKFGKAAGGDDA
jgi:hypothetical protein